MAEENNKLKPYAFPVLKKGGVAIEKVKDEIGEDLDTSDITAIDLQFETTDPNNSEE